MRTGPVARLLSRSVVAATPIVLLLTLGVGRADAQSADAPTCDPADQAHITATLTTDGHATFTVTNALPLCDPVPIGFAVYLKDADGLVFPQSLADSATDTITSGSKELAVTMPQNGTHPTCFTQIDAFTGSVLPQITETQRYNERLLAYAWGQVPNCGEVLGESTSTSETTTTLSTTTTDMTSTTRKNRSSVDAISVTNSSVAPPRTSAALARTGPAVDFRPLMTASGWLLAFGGVILALAHLRPRRHVS